MLSGRGLFLYRKQNEFVFGYLLIDPIVVPRKWIERAQLVPTYTHLVLGVAIEAANVSTNLTKASVKWSEVNQE